MRLVVAFSSPKRSALTVEVASRQAKALQAELILLRIVPDPEKVGVVAQLISSERPIDKAKMQIDEAVARLKGEGVNVSGIVRVGEVARGIIEIAEELKADMLFVGTASVKGHGFFMMQQDPIVHYLVDHCPISLCLVRPETSEDTSDVD
jgi:nucleotide-binding universal stress UspA family protein